MIALVLSGVFVVLLLCVAVNLKVKTMRMDKVARNIPGLKTRALIGNTAFFRRVRTLTDGFYKLVSITDNCAEYGLMKLWFANRLGVIIWDPEYIQIVSNSPAAASKGEVIQMIMGEVGNGLFAIPGGKTWKELRKPLTKAMTKKQVEINYLPVMVRKSESYLKFIETHREGRFFDVLEDLSSLALSVFSETHLGLEVDEIWNRKWYLVNTVHKLFDLGIPLKMKYLFYFWRIGAMFRHKKDLAIIDDGIKLISDFMQWMLDERRKGGFVRSDGIEFYTDFLLRRGREKHISDAALRKELFDVVTASVDTTAVLVSTTLVFLAMFPECQEKVYQELVQLMEDDDPEYSGQLLAEMEYLEMVLKETLRLVSPPGIFKYIEDDIEIGEYTIPKGCYVYLFLYRTHRDPRFWERPESFYPEHFTPEKQAARPHSSFLPFGCGIRTCPGFQYGMIQAKTWISKILRRYRVTTNIKYEDNVYDFKIMLTMKYQIKFERR